MQLMCASVVTGSVCLVEVERHDHLIEPSVTWCHPPDVNVLGLVLRARRGYETSTLYRDLKLRGSIIREKQLITLPLEQIYSKVRDVVLTPSLPSSRSLSAWNSVCVHVLCFHVDRGVAMVL